MISLCPDVTAHTNIRAASNILYTPNRVRICVYDMRGKIIQSCYGAH